MIASEKNRQGPGKQCFPVLFYLCSLTQSSTPTMTEVAFTTA